MFFASHIMIRVILVLFYRLHLMFYVSQVVTRVFFSVVVAHVCCF